MAGAYGRWPAASACRHMVGVGGCCRVVEEVVGAHRGHLAVVGSHMAVASCRALGGCRRAQLVRLGGRVGVTWRRVLVVGTLSTEREGCDTELQARLGGREVAGARRPLAVVTCRV